MLYFLYTSEESVEKKAAKRLRGGEEANGCRIFQLCFLSICYVVVLTTLLCIALYFLHRVSNVDRIRGDRSSLIKTKLISLNETEARKKPPSTRKGQKDLRQPLLLSR